MAVFRQAFNIIGKYSGVPLGFPNLGQPEPETGFDNPEHRTRFYNQPLGRLPFALPTICLLRKFPALLAKNGACPNSLRSNKGRLSPFFAAMLGCIDGSAKGKRPNGSQTGRPH
jgi:hypothetical protein